MEPRARLARDSWFSALTLDPSLSFAEPQFPHLDPGMTVPTARKQLQGVYEKVEVKVCCELEESVVVIAESA